MVVVTPVVVMVVRVGGGGAGRGQDAQRQDGGEDALHGDFLLGGLHGEDRRAVSL